MKMTPSKMPQDAPERAAGYLHTLCRLIAGLQCHCNGAAAGLPNQTTVLLVNSAVLERPDRAGQLGMANAFEMLQDDWVQLAPYGDFFNVGPMDPRTRKPLNPKGYIQRFEKPDADKIVETFNTGMKGMGNRWIGLPFYVEHPDQDPAAFKDRSAYGRIKAVETRADGLYGQVKWSKAGLELINDGRYGYLSPAWWTIPTSEKDAQGRTIVRPIELKNAGLTNMPNMPVMPLANSEQFPGLQSFDLSTLTDDERAQLRVELANYGTSEGARKGWETRRANSAGKQKALVKATAKARAPKSTAKKGSSAKGAPKPTPPKGSAITEHPAYQKAIKEGASHEDAVSEARNNIGADKMIAKMKENAAAANAEKAKADPVITQKPAMPRAAVTAAAKKPGLFSSLVSKLKHTW